MASNAVTNNATPTAAPDRRSIKLATRSLTEAVAAGRFPSSMPTPSGNAWQTVIL